jgi:hypothetical protein
MVHRTAALLVAIVVLSAANANATLIDSFDVASQSSWASASIPDSSSQAHPGTTTAIGGYRDVAIHWLLGAKSYVDVLTGMDGSELAFAQGSGQAETTVTWDGANSPNVLSYSLGADLTTNGNNEFVLDIAEVTGTGLNLTMTVYNTDGIHASTYTTVVPANTVGDFAIKYSSFTSTSVGISGIADFVHTGAIVLDLSGSSHSGSDITINSISTATGTTAPEPSTLTMLLGTLAVFGLLRRRA